MSAPGAASAPDRRVAPDRPDTPHADGGAPLLGCLLFHLNLRYSSIEPADRPRVVERCYRPLLGLLEGRPWLRIAVEASGHTLERAAELDPGWIAGLRAAVAAGRIELVGSGDTQLIGPLVPAAVNRWNQRLGQETYERLLGCRPRTALVGEMAWSQGLIDAYREAGYVALCMEWNNPRRSHPEWEDGWRWRPAVSVSPLGRPIALHWTDAIAFQKFQRAVVGDLEPREYRAWVARQRGPAAERDEPPRHLFLYANDAEVFDFRPGRYAAEPLPNPRGEWRVMGELLDGLHADGVRFALPAELLEPALAEAVLADAACADWPRVRLASFADPVPVKKQPKYNVTRWALSGRDDVGLNSRCFARAARLTERADGGSPAAWRALCRAWASDLRTHLTEERWSALRAGDAVAPGRLDALPPARLARAAAVDVEREGRWLRVRTDGVDVTLDTRRGLAIRSLVLSACGEAPVLGTLPHGYFDHIDWAADFYSGHCVYDLPAEARVTDLGPAETTVERADGEAVVRGRIETPLGPLEERVRVGADALVLEYGFAAWGERRLGSLRAAILTLDPDLFGGAPLAVRCANGGAPERFPFEPPCDHGASVSAFVSARAALGATDGRLAIEGGGRALELAWPQELAAALPLLAAQDVAGRRWLRVAFSLSEVDETHRPGAPLRDFRLVIGGGPAPAPAGEEEERP